MSVTNDPDSPFFESDHGIRKLDPLRVVSKQRIYVSHAIKGQTPERIALMEQLGIEYVTDVLEAEPLLPRTIAVFDHGNEPCPRILDAGQGAMHDWSCYMRAGLIEMLKCDAILMMPGWTSSKGATLELYLCVSVGIPTFFYEATQQWKEFRQMEETP